jgi:hypothetical protein
MVKLPPISRYLLERIPLFWDMDLRQFVNESRRFGTTCFVIFEEDIGEDSVVSEWGFRLSIDVASCPQNNGIVSYTTLDTSEVATLSDRRTQ